MRPRNRIVYLTFLPMLFGLIAFGDLWLFGVVGSKPKIYFPLTVAIETLWGAWFFVTFCFGVMAQTLLNPRVEKVLRTRGGRVCHGLGLLTGVFGLAVFAHQRGTAFDIGLLGGEMVASALFVAWNFGVFRYFDRDDEWEDVDV